MVEPAIAALTPEQRSVVARTWRQRAASEHRASRSFEGIAMYLASRSAPRSILDLATRAIEDELRHARLCLELAERYEQSEAELGELGAPSEATLAMLISSCCISETLGAAYLDHVRVSAAGPSVRQVAQELLGDEIGHARVGWATVASLEPEEKRAVGAALPELLRATSRVWTQRVGELPTPPVPGHGCHGAAEILAIAEDAMRTLVLPGFEHVGV